MSGTVSVSDSILNSIKKMLGIQEEYPHFDPDVILCINSALAILTQLGVGPENGFSITDSSTVWSEFLDDEKQLEMVKSFVHLRVRLLFDPPQNASLMESIEKMAKELEWRIQVAGEAVSSAKGG